MAKRKSTKGAKKGVAKKRTTKKPVSKAAKKRGATRTAASGNATLPPPPKEPVELSEELAGQIYDAEEQGWLEEREKEEKKTRSLRRSGSRPLVIVLPGILGSPIGRADASGKTKDVIWLDLKELPCGGLGQLALPGGYRLQALYMEGLLYGFYKPTYKAIRAAGFDCWMFPFDWRLSLKVLGKQFADWLHAHATNREVHLVAHSMGGLVCRRMFSHLDASRVKLKSFITAGTPLGGSASPLLAMRELHSMAGTLAKFDFQNDHSELAEVFASFAGLLEMMPRGEFASLDLFDRTEWPNGPFPKALRKTLGPASSALGQLGLPPEGCAYHTIFGDGVPTITGVESASDGFEFQVGTYGDGTVPTKFARAGSGVTSEWFVHSDGKKSDVAEHGSLLKRPIVADAIVRLLKRKSPALHRSALPQRAIRIISETELRDRDGKIRRGGGVPRTRQDILDVNVDLMRMTVSLPEPAKPQAEFLLDAVSVRKTRSRYLEIEVVHGNVADLEADALVFGIFEGLDPVGAMAAADRPMNGALSEAISRRQFQGHAGGVYLLPAGRRLKADYVVMLGLGSPQHADPNVLHSAAGNLIRTLCRSRIDHFATVLMGSGIGDVSRRLEPLLLGMIQTLEEVDPTREFRRITLCEFDPTAFDEIREELMQLATSPSFTNAIGDVELDFRERHMPKSVARLMPKESATRQSRPGTLFLRTEREIQTPKKETGWRVDATWHDPKGSAALLNGSVSFKERELEALLGLMPDWNRNEQWSMPKLEAFGKALSGLLLPQEIAAALQKFDRHLVVVHDTPLSKLPWETIRLGTRRPALELGMSRRIVLRDHVAGKWANESSGGGELRVLLVCDPTEDLDGAREECKGLEEILGGPGVQLTRLNGPQATKAAISNAIESQRFDVLHCASHAQFVPESPSESGIVCAGSEVFSGLDLMQSREVPSLIFINACESARLRKSANEVRKKLNEHPAASLAEAFLSAGVAQFLGTYWPVGDSGAAGFSKVFYDAVKKGGTVADGVLAGRKAIAGDPDWADYIHYGQPDFTLTSAEV